MPKLPPCDHAAKAVAVQRPADRMHCRTLHPVLQQAGNRARLRAACRQNVLEVQAMPHRDSWVRRLFSRTEIESERLALRAALAQAASNMTPERLQRLGSPGRRALRVLQFASGMRLDRDVRVGQIRSATALLAGTGKKRSFTDSPARSRSGWLRQAGATGLTSADGVRRAQLRMFCVGSADAGSLPALLARSGDKAVCIASSISIFRAAALNFIVEDMKGGKRTPQALAAQIRRRSDSVLLRLFIARWRQAAAEGKISRNAWTWFDAVDWLVNVLHGARPTSPGATRAPKSPRIGSTAAAPPARVRAASSSSRSVIREGRPQQGRQGASLRMLDFLQSPTRLADTPLPSSKPGRTVSRGADAPPAPGPAAAAAPAPASSLPVSPGGGWRPPPRCSTSRCT